MELVVDEDGIFIVTASKNFLLPIAVSYKKLIYNSFQTSLMSD